MLSALCCWPLNNACVLVPKQEQDQIIRSHTDFVMLGFKNRILNCLCLINELMTGGEKYSLDPISRFAANHRPKIASALVIIYRSEELSFYLFSDAYAPISSIIPKYTSDQNPALSCRREGKFKCPLRRKNAFCAC